MIDILFRGGYTVEESTTLRRARADRNAVSKLVAERRLSFKDGSFHAKVGERLEAEEDYAEHYKALEENGAAHDESLAGSGLLREFHSAPKHPLVVVQSPSSSTGSIPPAI